MTFSPVPPSVLEGFDTYDSFILVGHDQPDADCLCSQLGLAALLKKRNKKICLLAKAPFTRPETKHLESLFTHEWKEPEQNTLLVLMDCSDPSRTGFPVEEMTNLPLMIIDHHASGKSDGKYLYIDHHSPSTTLLVQRLWEAAGETPDPETSDYLFFGFATDTGFFRHLEEGTEEVFQVVSSLIRQGASPNRTFRQISAGRQLGTRRLMGRILDRSRFHCGGRIIISWETEADRKELGTDERDSDKLYQLLQSVEGCEAVALLRQEEKNLCIVGLRSNNHVDVGLIASELGGGGHKKASGCAVEGSIETVQERLLEMFRKQL